MAQAYMGLPTYALRLSCEWKIMGICMGYVNLRYDLHGSYARSSTKRRLRLRACVDTPLPTPCGGPSAEANFSAPDIMILVMLYSVREWSPCLEAQYMYIFRLKQIIRLTHTSISRPIPTLLRMYIVGA